MASFTEDSRINVANEKEPCGYIAIGTELSGCKFKCREGLALGSNIRVSIWPSLCHINNDLHMLRVPEDHVVSKIATNRFNHLCSISTSKVDHLDGLVTQEKIKLSLFLLCEQFGIEYQENIRALLRIVFGHISDVPLVTSLLMDILEQPVVYRMSVSYHSHVDMIHVFNDCLKSAMPKTHSILCQGFESENNFNGTKQNVDEYSIQSCLHFNYMNEFFQNFLVNLLPHRDHTRMMDCYFAEGYKILFRYAMAFIVLFKHVIKEGRMVDGSRVKFKSAVEFWNYVQTCKLQYENKSESNAGSTDSGAAICYYHIHSIAFDGHRNKLVSLWRPLHFSRAVIQSKACDDKLEFYQQGVNSPDIRAGSATSDNCIVSGEALSQISDILKTTSHAENIWKNLPVADRLEGFECCFSTDRHGFSLDTLYTLTKHCYPCIVVVQGLPITLSPTKRVIPIVGFYSAQRISPISSAVQGDHRCFCFRFSDAVVGAEENRSSNRNIASSSASGTTVERESTGAVNQVFKTVSSNASNNGVDPSVDIAPTVTQYYVSNKHYLSVGGSAKHMSSAIRINQELTVCTSGPSDTYGNDQTLIPEAVPWEKANICLDSSMPIAKIEVLCGKYAKIKQRNVDGSMFTLNIDDTSM